MSSVDTILETKRIKKRQPIKYGAHHVKANCMIPKPIMVKTYASAKKPIVATVTPDTC